MIHKNKFLKFQRDKISPLECNQSYFENSWLDPEHPTCTADEYFRQICYTVSLNDLYEIQETCYYNEEMLYCPVILKIGVERVRQAYGNCQYLLQVWHKNTNQKVYEQPLNGKAIYLFLVFTLSGESDNSKYLHIIDLEGDNKIVKIKNFGQEADVKYLAYHNSKLMVASSEEIRVMMVSPDLFTKEGHIIEVTSDNPKIRKFNPKQKIHGLIVNQHSITDNYQLVALETFDNQLDFNKFFITDFDDDEKLGFKWEQYRHILPRAHPPHDPIIKSCFIFSNNESNTCFNYSVSLRKSGAFDIYWNMQKRDTVTSLPVVDVKMTSTSFYFKLSDGRFYQLDHNNKSNINFQPAEIITDQDFNYEKVHINTVQNKAKPFTGVQMLKLKDESRVVICHGKFYSIFEIVQQKWIAHIEFETDILFMFRHYHDATNRYQSIVLKNGDIFVGILSFDEYKEMVPSSKKDTNIPGKIERISEDVENSKTMYFSHKVDNKMRLSVLFRSKIRIVEEFKDPHDNVSVVCLQYRGDDSHILVQNDKTFTLMKQHKEYKLEQIAQFTLTNVKGMLHSGSAVENVSKNIIVFDQFNGYLIKKQDDDTYKCFVFPDVYCVGFQNFTKNFNYAICQKATNGKYPGLRMFDMEYIARKEQIDMLLLKKMEIGTLGYFEFSATMNRFAFLSSLSHVMVTPVLHRNMIRFIGSGAVDDYLCYTTINDTFCALTKTGFLMSWNIYTAKFMKSVKQEHLDIDKYDVQSKYKKNRILVRTKEKVEGEKMEDYFMPWELHPYIEGQKTFIEGLTTNFKRWRLLEIVSSDEVRIQMEYIFPSYEKQWIFINDRMDRLITIYSNYRTYYHQAVRIFSETPGQNLYKMELVRCLPDYPSELENDAGYLDFFSPCFSRYINFDQKTCEYLIKDTKNGDEIVRVPKEFMSIEKDNNKPEHVINRMLWVDARTILIVDEQGSEKLLDIDNNFEEISYNQRPLFNEVEPNNAIEWKTRHYYKLRGDLNNNSILLRLQRRYQEYKTDYFIFRKSKPEELLKCIFKVDDIQFNQNSCSFSFSHWSLIEQIQKGQIKIEDLEMSVIQNLIYDILPGGNTILHMISEQKEQVAKLLDVCHPENTIKFHIPFIPNFQGITPLHQLIQLQDFKTTDLVLKYLALYPIGHHSRSIRRLFPKIIEQQVPSFLQVYLDSRFQQTPQLDKIDQGTLLPNPPDLFVSDLWFKEGDIKSLILDPVQTVDQNFKLEFLDMPGVYHYNDEAFPELIKQLADTDKFEYFDNRAIQKIIEFNYKVVQEYISYAIIIPFLVFHTTFVVYMNVVYEHRNEDAHMERANWILAIILIAFATYFLLLEVIQFVQQGIRYISSIWNYIDIIAPIGIYGIQVLQFLNMYGYEIDETFNRCVLAISTFFMWLKLLYVLRIFRKTGYLIRMIVEVMADMGIFLLILLITIFAFGDSFLRISSGNIDEDTQFTNQFFLSALFAYRMILGDFDTSAFGEVAVPLVWAFFTLCTIFDMIVMLNLLIAIISDTYARMTENSDQAAYQEMASLIAENLYLVPMSRKKTYCKKNRFLVCLTDLEKQQRESNDPVQDKLIHIQRQTVENKKQIDTLTTKVTTNIEDIGKFKKAIESKLDDIIKANQERKQEQIELEQSKIHLHSLKKLTLKQVQSLHSGYSSFGCDGRHFTDCKGGMTKTSDRKKDPKDIIYHCFKCSFVQCEKCFDSYKGQHHHELFKATYEQLQNLSNYQAGWLCDSVHFLGCKNQNGDKALFSDINTVLYHCSGCEFDLCQSCMSQNRA